MLLATYWLPEVISRNPADIITPKEESEIIQSESFDYQTTDLEPEKLPVAGLGSYVGQKIENFTEKFGNPKRIDPTVYEEESWIFGKDETDYAQLIVKNGIITDLFVLGSELDVAPFKIGMSITEVFQLASFYPTYSVENQGEQLTLELTESDLNYRPLIAFDNQTFAVLMMDRSTNQIIAVRYLDSPSLIRLGVYDDGSKKHLIPSFEVDEIRQDAINEANQKQAYEILNILRQRYELSALTPSDALTGVAETIFTNQGEQIIADRQADKESSFSETETSDNAIKNQNSSIETFILDDNSDSIDEQTNQPYQTLTSEQIERTLQETELELNEVRVLYSIQETDVAWLATNWFSLEIERNFLMDASMTEIGLFYRANDMLLILH
ncbi:hypothetical protein CAR_c09280 [Carnobacterium sp. 17-4]|nr:hypothetical protein CAR_c09280 [Carnobacterium sp. 17-4]